MKDFMQLDGALKAGFGVTSRFIRPVSHIHIAVACFKFVEHLIKTLLLRLFLFGSNNPPDVIIPLVGWPAVICIHKPLLGKGISNKFRHRVYRSSLAFYLIFSHYFCIK
ncbi:MAG: hypothetical protein HW384_2211 [Dehalococcoidia bacterium]|nr:hypothetical protein [Dehalococcoidia bacterium]MBF8304586.1 hypothetical protein [Dehalococcoidia bacterium]